VNIAPNDEREVVLVVDDESTVRRFARRVLIEHGYDVHEASDGSEALEVVGSLYDRLDVVVSDIVMPRVNGVELLRQLAMVRPELPVILMSGYAGPQLAERGIEAPCSILTKPFSAETLVAEVRRCIRGQPT
jgi:two-component system, cell cycle sensor histidine kinase and response regulator CckA